MVGLKTDLGQCLAGLSAGETLTLNQQQLLYLATQCFVPLTNRSACIKAGNSMLLCHAQPIGIWYDILPCSGPTSTQQQIRIRQWNFVGSLE